MVGATHRPRVGHRAQDGEEVRRGGGGAAALPAAAGTAQAGDRAGARADRPLAGGGQAGAAEAAAHGAAHLGAADQPAVQLRDRLLDGAAVRPACAGDAAGDLRAAGVRLRARAGGLGRGGSRRRRGAADGHLLRAAAGHERGRLRADLPDAAHRGGVRGAPTGRRAPTSAITSSAATRTFRGWSAAAWTTPAASSRTRSSPPSVSRRPTRRACITTATG